MTDDEKTISFSANGLKSASGKGLLYTETLRFEILGMGSHILQVDQYSNSLKLLKTVELLEKEYEQTLLLINEYQKGNDSGELFAAVTELEKNGILLANGIFGESTANELWNYYQQDILRFFVVTVSFYHEYFMPAVARCVERWKTKASDIYGIENDIKESYEESLSALDISDDENTPL